MVVVVVTVEWDLASIKLQDYRQSIDVRRNYNSYDVLFPQATNTSPPLKESSTLKSVTLSAKYW